jgi:hypothetical protein
MKLNRRSKAYRISLKKEVIILASAWRTARSSPLASHSHFAFAGEQQIAQSGSIDMEVMKSV